MFIHGVIATLLVALICSGVTCICRRMVQNQVEQLKQRYELAPSATAIRKQNLYKAVFMAARDGSTLPLLNADVQPC